jgi:hypothetical protein
MFINFLTLKQFHVKNKMVFRHIYNEEFVFLNLSLKNIKYFLIFLIF